MNNHTVTPWLYEPAHKGFVITAKDGQYDIAVVRDIGNEENETNAAHIVKCVNCHDELLEALKLADAALSGSNMNMEAVQRKVQAAIAKAEEEHQ